MVKCPICAKAVSLELINKHLDQCERESPSKLKRPVEIIDVEETGRTDDNDDNDDNDEDGDRPPKKRTNLSNILMTQKAKQAPTPQKSSYVYTPKREPERETRPESELLPPTPSKLSKEDEIKLLRSQSHLPLSERLRPKTLEDYVGQQHLLGLDGILRNFINSDKIPSLILWGPPGVGKTTIARIIASRSSHKLVELNATNSGIQELRKVFENCVKEFFLTKRKSIVFMDEIHRFNKTQQDFFLPFVEKGDIILIGATTENPSFQLNNALLSRCKVFTLKKLDVKEIHTILNKGILHINKQRKLVLAKPLLRLTKEVIDHLSDLANGDSRSAINLLEIVDSNFLNHPIAAPITLEQVRPILQKTHLLYDRVGDSHYDTISAFHKSIRGSDANAALWYLGLMLEGGENPLYIARRMIRIASEDIGVLDESCLPFAIAAYQAVTFVGMPEADLALVQCAVKLAEAKKSVKIYKAWGEIKKTIRERVDLAGKEIPIHLRNAPTKLMAELGYGEDYKYNPDYKDGKVVQRYLPSGVDQLKFLDKPHLGDKVDPDLYKQL